jgi:hypothetical protein
VLDRTVINAAAPDSDEHLAFHRTAVRSSEAAIVGKQFIFEVIAFGVAQLLAAQRAAVAIAMRLMLLTEQCQSA